MRRAGWKGNKRVYNYREGADTGRLPATVVQSWLGDSLQGRKFKHVYFVAESKGNDLQGSQLRGSEESKIECTRRHFKAISDNGYIYDVAKDYKSLYDIVTK